MYDIPSGRFDVLVHTEEIVRIVFLLNLNQAVPNLLRIGFLDTILTFIAQEVHIDTLGKRFRCTVEVPRPGKAPLVVRGVAPSDVNLD